MSIQIQPVLMSGGSGTRLWPLSRRGRPKQFATFMGAHTLFQETILRVSGHYADVEFLAPIVIGAVAHGHMIRAQMESVGKHGKIVLEPMPRNTAPCAAVSASLVADDSPDTLILLLPCDHVIQNVTAFRAAIRQGATAAQAGYVVTFGVRPTSPETAFGYIKAGQRVGDVFVVQQFSEKPDLTRAQSYLAEGGWTWNAGIFLFRAGTMISELERHAADILLAARSALSAASEIEDGLLLDPGAFSLCRPDSIDHAVAEKTTAAAVVPVDMQWSDVGLWSAVWQLSNKDLSGNATTGDVTMTDTRDCLAISDGIPIMLAGVQGLVVVVQNGTVLVTRPEASPSVKVLVETLKARNREDLI